MEDWAEERRESDREDRLRDLQAEHYNTLRNSTIAVYDKKEEVYIVQKGMYNSWVRNMETGKNKQVPTSLLSYKESY